MLEGTEPGPLMVVIQGGHDSQNLSERFPKQLHYNFMLALLRADSVRKKLEGQFGSLPDRKPTYVTTARSESHRDILDSADRTVTLTFIAPFKGQVQ
jgi:hypothetical protein